MRTRKYDRSGGWMFVKSEDLTKAQWLMPLAATPLEGGDEMTAITFDGRTYEGDDFLRYVGWWIAEGWMSMGAPALCQAVGAQQSQDGDHDVLAWACPSRPR